MTEYIMRLDDASDYMDIEKWNRMECLLDKYNVKPIFGIIPDNHDEALISEYERNPDFWCLVHSWIDKGWTPALHGYEHRYVTDQGGINPINNRSEFAGLPYEEQADKIDKGWNTLLAHNIKPEVFFAPSHTFDRTTLEAIKEKTDIRVICDTIACDVYKEGDFWIIPQQSGRVRRIPLKTVTFCYHPNMMKDADYQKLESFLQDAQFSSYSSLKFKNRSLSLIDKIIKKVYFIRRHH